MPICPNGHDSASDDVCDVCGVRVASGPAPAPARLVGRHHAGGPRPAEVADGTCPWCGAASPGQFCERCGFRVRRAFAHLGESKPATSAPWEPAVPPDPLPPEPGRPLFLDWFKSPEPSEPEAPREPEPAPQPAALGGPESYSWSAQPVSPSLPPPAAPAVGVPSSGTWTAVVTSDRAYYERPQITVDLLGSAPPFPAYSTERRFPLAGNQMRIGRSSAARGLHPEIDLSGPPADPGVSRLHALLIPAADGTWAVLDPGSANGTMLNGREIAVGELVPLHDGDKINVGAWTAITVQRG